MRQFRNTLNRRTVTQFPSLASLFDHELEFEKYECIYYMGDTAAQVYMVKEGKVKVSRISSTGKEKVLHIFEPGDVFGELSLYAEGIRSEQAIAMEKVRVACVEKSDLLRVVASRPVVANDLLRLLSSRLLEAQDQIETLSFDKTSLTM